MILSFLKRWMLPVAMLSGAGAYLIYHYFLDFLHPYSPVFEGIISALQPLLIFAMLFLSFSQLAPSQLRPHRWQMWLLTAQSLVFILSAVATMLWIRPETPFHYFMQCFMICMICPTATAASVVTKKLGGDMAGLITYTVLINIWASVLIPLFVPLVHPIEGVTFWTAFCMILAKVFPLLMGPCLAAWVVRYLIPSLHRRIEKCAHWGFYLWSVALFLAILMSLRALYRSQASAWVVFLLALASALACVFNFAIGKYCGRRYESMRKGRRNLDSCDKVVGVTQSLGQKNTVFAIWLGYTFFSPLTSITGGLYSIWQNSFNAWQLEQKRKKDRDI